MLTLPSVHPALMALLTDGPLEQKWLESIPQETWEAIVNDAIAQRVAPILFHRIKHSTHRLQIPSRLHQRLHQQIIQLAAWNLVLTDELLRILTACRLQNIECIPIRGPLLAAQLYGDDAIRQMDDLDLLVHYENLSTVNEIFYQLGYAPHEHRSGFLETYSYSLEFYHLRHGVIVEPHWTLAYPPVNTDAAMGPVWARTERRRILDIETATLCHADLLVHLCLHLLHKGTHAPLLWYYELDRLIRLGGDSMSWEVVIAQAREMDQAGLIAEVLTTVVHRFHSPVSESILKDLLEPSAGTASRSTRPMSEQMLTHSSLHGREEFAVLCSLRNLLPKVHYAAALLFPSPSYMAQRYGLSGFRKLPLAYFLRAYHLLGNGCRWAIAWIRAALSPRQG
jgi:hypothetical protein